MLFGLHGPAKIGQYSFLPLQSQTNIKIISMNILYNNEDQSVIWKESLTGEVINLLCSEIEWGALDYLLIDMPPATSEAGVTIMESLTINGVIIVTTPQKMTTQIVNKAVATVQKIGIPILGVVENMAYYLMPDTDEKQFIFGQYCGESVAEVAQAPILAQIPFDPMATKICDLGKIEEVSLDESSQFVDAFLKSLLDLPEIEASPKLVYQNTGVENTCVCSTQQGFIDEESEDGGFSSSQFDQICEPYSDIVMQLIHKKENMGTLDGPDAQGFFIGSCGDRMQIDLQIVSGRILDAGFVADGCGVTIACGSMITKMACSKNLDEAKQITPEDLLTVLGGLPDNHKHCAELAVMALREAVIDAEEGHGQPMS